MNDAVTIEGRGSPVWTLTMNRPERRNAFDEELHPAILEGLREVARNTDVRALVITGSGTVFSAGGDIGLIHRLRTDATLRHNTFELSREIFRTLLSLDVPVVAAVNGPAIGAGCTLALLCDVVVMSETASLGDPRIRLGLVSGDGGAVLWPILVGLPVARLHLLSGDVIDAAEAHRIGLVARIAAPESMLSEALALASQIASFSVVAVRETKRILNSSVPTADSPVFDRALYAESDAITTPEHLEAVTAYEARLRERREKS